MRPCHHGWRCARGMRLGGVDGQMAVHSGPSKRTFEAMQPDWMLRLTSGFLQNSSCTLPDTPAPPARAQDGRKAPNGIRLCIITVWRIVHGTDVPIDIASLRLSWTRVTAVSRQRTFHLKRPRWSQSVGSEFSLLAALHAAVSRGLAASETAARRPGGSRSLPSELRSTLPPPSMPRVGSSMKVRQ